MMIRKYNFSLYQKYNELHTTSEDVEAFEIENEELPIRHIVASFRFRHLENALSPDKTDTPEDFRFGLTNYPADKNFPKGIQVAAYLVDLSEETVSVRIANVSDKARIIKKDDEIVSCAPITSIGKASGKTAPPTLFQELIEGSKFE